MIDSWQSASRYFIPPSRYFVIFASGTEMSKITNTFSVFSETDVNLVKQIYTVLGSMRKSCWHPTALQERNKQRSESGFVPWQKATVTVENAIRWKRNWSGTAQHITQYNSIHCTGTDNITRHGIFIHQKIVQYRKTAYTKQGNKHINTQHRSAILCIIK